MWTPPNDTVVGIPHPTQPGKTIWVAPNDTVVGSPQPQTPQTPPWANLLRALGLGSIPSGIGAIENMPNEIRYMTNKSNPNARQEYINNMRQNPLLNQNSVTQFANNNPLGAIENEGKEGASTASWLISPEAAGVKSFIAKNAASGALSGLGQQNATPQSVAGSTLMSLLTAGTMKKIPSMINNAGSSLVQHGENVLLHDLKPNASQIAKFAKASGGQDIADYIKQNGWNDNFVHNAINNVQNLQDAFDQLARNTTTQVPTSDLTKAFQPYINELQNNAVASVKNKASNLEDLLQSIQDKYGDSMTINDITNERKNLDDLLNQNQYGLPAADATYLRSGRNALHDAVVNAVQGQKVNDMDVGQIGKELSKAITFKDIAQQQSNVGRGGKNVGLLPTIVGSATAPVGAVIGNAIGGPLGGLAGGVIGGATGIGAQKLINSTTAVKGESKASTGLGNILQKVSNSNLPLNTSDYLLRLLRNAGASIGSDIGGMF